jgi:Family of unknown function (DUF6065)
MEENRRDGVSRSTLPETGPEAAFFSVYPDAPLPVPAREVLPGALPLSAVRKCPPVTTASSLGWLLNPPVSFAVRWLEEQLWWAHVDDDTDQLGEWEPVVGNGPRVPALAAALDEVAGDRRAEVEATGLAAMPLLDPSPNGDPREFQVISGMVASTAAGWALLIRGVPNRPRPSGAYDVMEGVVETAWSGHVLPVMVRLRTEGRVVRFSRHEAIAALQPVAVASYSREASWVRTSGRGVSSWPDDMWERFVRGRVERMGPEPASYRRAQASYYRESLPVADDHD